MPLPRFAEVAGEGLALPLIVASIFTGTDWSKILGTFAAVIIAIGYIARFFTARMALQRDINGLGGSLRAYNQKQDARIAELEEKFKTFEGSK